MTKIESHRDLIVCQKAMDMAVQVYKITAAFSSQEKFGMTSQVTHSAVSVAANIAEGNARGSAKDYAHFLAIARGSLMGTETFLLLATRLDYVPREALTATLSLVTETDRMLCSLRGTAGMNNDSSSLPSLPSSLDVSGLLNDLRRLVAEARQRVAVAVNRELTLMHWHIGDTIRRDILREERAAYGEQITATLSRQLTAEFGRGYSVQNLLHMMQFVEAFPAEKILSTLSRQLGWSHFKEIIYIKDRLKREFYAEMCRLEKWSVRTLRAKIDGMLYERTVLSGKAEAVIDAEIASLRESDQLTPDLVFRDPYLLDFWDCPMGTASAI